jgi:hypothetical protein
MANCPRLPRGCRRDTPGAERAQIHHVHNAIKWHGAWSGVPGVDELETRPYMISWFDIEGPDGNESERR